MKKKTKNSDIPVVMLLAQMHEYKIKKSIKLKKIIWETEFYHAKNMEVSSPIMPISKLFKNG
jgi:hypothetical protein